MTMHRWSGGLLHKGIRQFHAPRIKSSAQLVQKPPFTTTQAKTAARPGRFGRFEVVLPSSSVLSGKSLDAPSRAVPLDIPRPEYVQHPKGEPHIVSSIQTKRDAASIEGMRAAGRLASSILETAREMVGVGITTEEMDKLLHEEIVKRKAYPSPLGYMRYPKSICTSVNNVIAHGRPLKDGDIVNVDVTVYYKGYHGDTSATFLVGNVDAKGRDLVDITRKSLENVIALCKPGVALSEIGRSIQTFAEKCGYSVNQDFCGHGIGRYFHEPPLIYHHHPVEDEGSDALMEPGMTFTIEPILCQGKREAIIWPDGWTAVTADGGRSAQFEHTVMIVPGGVEVLTKH